MAGTGLLIGVVASVSLIGLSQSRIERAFRWPYPALTELIVSEHYASDLGALAIGTRRLASDLAYIQFMQYYGKPETAGDVHHEDDGHDHAGGHFDFGGGRYPEVLNFGQRIVRLDPYFTTPVLEIAGALAFNLNRTDEALILLKEASRRNLSFFRYRLYIAAILYKNGGDDRELVKLLEEALQFPDCPVILENVLAGLLKKQGEPEKAARVYLHTMTTAPSAHDRETAQRRLLELIHDHPAVRPIVEAALGQ